MEYVDQKAHENIDSIIEDNEMMQTVNSYPEQSVEYTGINQPPQRLIDYLSQRSLKGAGKIGMGR